MWSAPTTVGLPEPEQVLAAASALAPRLRAAADEIDRQRRLPEDVLAAMEAAGIFRIMLPRDVGGFEFDLVTYARVIEAVFAANGSAGWVLAIFGNTGYMSLGWLSEEGVRQVAAANQRLLIAGATVPPGHAHFSTGWAVFDTYLVGISSSPPGSFARLPAQLYPFPTSAASA